MEVRSYSESVQLGGHPKHTGGIIFISLIWEHPSGAGAPGSREEFRCGCMDDFWHIDLRKLLLTLTSFCFALKFWTQDVSLSLPACCWGRGCRPENKNKELKLSKKLHKSQQNCSRWFIVIILFHITQLFNPLKGRCVLRRETLVSFPTVAV